MKTVKIAKGWFRIAGSIYHWPPEFDMRGVGIDADTLKGNESIAVNVQGKSYILDCKEAVDFVRKYSSFQTMSGGTKLGVISASLLKAK
jgi:hypothetical protein